MLSDVSQNIFPKGSLIKLSNRGYGCNFAIGNIQGFAHDYEWAYKKNIFATIKPKACNVVVVCK